MEVTLLEIKHLLADLISGKKTRAEVVDWANERQVANNIRNLQYDPADEEGKIWKAILYFTKVNAFDNTGNEKYKNNDFIKFQQDNCLVLYNTNLKYPIVVTIDDIKQAFDDLICERKTREEIYEWASERMWAEDDRALKFIPPDEEDRIWKALKYLASTDAEGDEEKYFYSIDDFIDFRNKLKLYY